MNTSWMKAKQTKYTAYATLYILIVIGILGLVNFLANRYNKSVDTTANKRYSLSDQTKKLVGDLKSDLIISYFDQTSGFQSAKDMLDRYQTLSPKVHVQYVDVLKKPQLARSYGVKSTGTAIVELGTKHE